MIFELFPRISKLLADYNALYSLTCVVNHLLFQAFQVFSKYATLYALVQSAGCVSIGLFWPFMAYYIYD